MANFADISLNDGQATPVAHIFKVKKTVDTLSSWEDRSGGVAIGYIRLSSQTKDNADVRRVTLKVAMPTLEAVSGANPSGFTPAPKVAYTTLGTVEFVIPQRSSAAEKKNILAYVKNALLNATLASLVTDGEEIAG